MKKDKAWLKEEVNEIKKLISDAWGAAIIVGNRHFEIKNSSEMQIVKRISDLIDQLYEPTKPVVPQFVADYIEQSKKDNDSINQVFAFIDDKEDKDLWRWLFPSMYEEKRANQEVFMRAWLDGYEVEKQKKYHIYDKSTKGYLGYNADKTRLSWYTSKFPNDVFTEKEIKAIDERYWAFAEEVTE